MTDFKRAVAEALSHALKTKEFSVAQLEGWLEVPPQPELGDYAFPCFKLAGHFKKAPVQIAVDLAADLAGGLQKSIGAARRGIRAVKPAGPYLNFFVEQAALAEQVLTKIRAEREKYGHTLAGKGKTIVNEYYGPNTNKPLHLGHLRNICLGLAVNQLFGSYGYKVVRTTIYNNRGAAICKAMLAYERWGEGKTPDSEAIKPDHFVGDYYVKFVKEAEKNPSLESEALEIIRKWEAGDKHVRALWQKMLDWVLRGYRQTITRLGVELDKEFFESDLYDKGKRMVEEGLAKGIFTRDEKGAIIADLEEEGLGKKHLLRADGTCLYITQDFYLAKLRHELFHFDQSIYVVASEQNLHFRQLFRCLELLGYAWAKKCYHLSYGLVNLPDGRMKSREGTVVDADDLLDELDLLAATEIRKRHADLPVA